MSMRAAGFVQTGRRCWGARIFKRTRLRSCGEKRSFSMFGQLDWLDWQQHVIVETDTASVLSHELEIVWSSLRFATMNVVLHRQRGQQVRHDNKRLDGKDRQMRFRSRVPMRLISWVSGKFAFHADMWRKRDREWLSTSKFFAVKFDVTDLGSAFALTLHATFTLHFNLILTPLTMTCVSASDACLCCLSKFCDLFFNSAVSQFCSSHRIRYCVIGCCLSACPCKQLAAGCSRLCTVLSLRSSFVATIRIQLSPVVLLQVSSAPSSSRTSRGACRRRW